MQKLPQQTYYNPVDKKWRREKCESLGFTYQEQSNKPFTPNMIPLELLNKRHSLYKTLSLYICGNQNIHLEIEKKIINTLRTNSIIEEFFGTRELLDEYIENNVKVSNTGEVESIGSYAETFAASLYLDTCIYVFEEIKNDWVLYYGKNWPKYDTLNMEDEKCIYLFVTGRFMGVVSKVTSP
ncbi:uncharacterized protein LOC126896327 isoform X2 [Daktulosphaira vitifoliae]|nr:uncharacterized protein LOC126896327 isoform X2 [Daktulosphaira vitifoliae]